MTIYVNLFGRPGVGKSTKAAELFVYVKQNWPKVSCELVTEVAKDFVWEERHQTLENQPYVTMKQYRNLKRLLGKVDLVITDTPLLLGTVYATGVPEFPIGSFKDFCLELHRGLGTSVNVLLEYPVDANYQQEGRIHTPEESSSLGTAIHKMLSDSGIEYVRRDPRSYNGELLNMIYSKLDMQ